jgi:hypothetical protein
VQQCIFGPQPEVALLKGFLPLGISAKCFGFGLLVEGRLQKGCLFAGMVEGCNEPVGMVVQADLAIIAGNGFQNRW